MNQNKDKIPSIKELRKICRPYKLDKYFVEFYNPIFSVYFTKFFIYFRITPNQITFLMIILAIIGSILLVPNNYFISILGAVTLLLSYFLDWVDGEVARFYSWEKNKKEFKENTNEKNNDEKKKFNLSEYSRLKGDYLDKMYHLIFTSSYLFAFGLNAYFKTDNIWFMTAGSLASIFFLLKNISTLRIFKSIYDYICLNSISELKIKKNIEKSGIITGDGSKSTVKHYIPLFIVIFNFQIFIVLIFSFLYFFLFWKNLEKIYRNLFRKKFNSLIDEK